MNKKYILILSAIFAFTFVSLAEEKEVVEFPQDYLVFPGTTQISPQFPGGQQALFDFLRENTQYPAEAVENGEQGRVVVRFTIDKTGKVTDIEIIRSISLALDKETIRIIELMPDWIPGEQRGEKVPVKMTIPITFAIPEE